jgi:hypothetical protein
MGIGITGVGNRKLIFMSKEIGCTGKRNPLWYNTSTQSYSDMESVVLDKYLNSFTVKNAGTTLLSVNQDILQPGESKSFGANAGEVYVGRCDINFVLQDPPPASIINSAVVTQKFYTKDTFE